MDMVRRVMRTHLGNGDDFDAFSTKTRFQKLKRATSGNPLNRIIRTVHCSKFPLPLGVGKLPLARPSTKFYRYNRLINISVLRSYFRPTSFTELYQIPEQRGEH